MVAHSWRAKRRGHHATPYRRRVRPHAHAPTMIGRIKCGASMHAPRARSVGGVLARAVTAINGGGEWSRDRRRRAHGVPAPAPGRTLNRRLIRRGRACRGPGRRIGSHRHAQAVPERAVVRVRACGAVRGRARRGRASYLLALGPYALFIFHPINPVNIKKTVTSKFLTHALSTK